MAPMNRPMAHADTVRIGPVVSIPSVLEQLGLGPEATLAELGFDIQMFENPDTIIPNATRSRLLELCAQKSGCRHFGHLVGRNISPSSYGIAGLFIQQAPDIASAIKGLIRYLHLHANGAVVYLEEKSDTAFVGYSITHPVETANEQVTDAAVTAIFNVLRKLCGVKWQATELQFTHAKPTNTRPFVHYFKAPLRFNSGRSGVLFPADWLTRPVLGADPELQRLLKKQIDLIEYQYPDSFAEQARRVVHSAVLMHRTKAGDIANFFSLRERTLNRRLRDSGTCLRELLDECRADIAQQLLRNTSLTVNEIAESLDYSDASAFARAFRRQTGMAPSAWRSSMALHH